MIAENTAKDVLRDPESFALTLCVAADKLTGGAHAAWEYETVWSFMEDLDCLPGEEGRERLMAATALRLNPAYLWDAGVFQSMVAAFNGRVATPEIVEQPSVGEVAWAVVEAELLRKHYGDDNGALYGAEPTVFTAAICADNGLVVIPAELSFCEEALPMMPSVGRESALEVSVREQLREPTPERPADVDDSDSAAVHARILEEVGHYVSTRKARLERDLVSLRA